MSVAAGEVAALTGHEVGRVCPFANPPGARVHLDESLRRFDTVFPAAGSARSAVEVATGELAGLSGAEGWVDVAVGWRPEEG